MKELSVMTLLNEAFGLSKPKPRDKYATARAKAKRIAKKIGAEIELVRDSSDRRNITYMVWPPKSIDLEYGAAPGVDPHEGDHSAWDWDEVLEMVEDYEKTIK